MRDGILDLYDISVARVRVIHNGIDTKSYRQIRDPAVLDRYGIEANKPFVLFVGRVTHQKGIVHLLRALHHAETDFQTVFCADGADMTEISNVRAKR
jgi:starch synthase